MTETRASTRPGPLARAGGWFWNQAYLLIALTTLFWAFNTVLGRFVSGTVPPVGLAFMRWTGAFLIVLAFAWRPLTNDLGNLKALPADERRRAWWLLALLGFTGITAYNTCLYVGLQYTQALNGLVLTSFGPVAVAFFVFVLTREALSWRQALGICVSGLGVMVVVTRGRLGTLLDLAFNVGDLWIVTGVALYGVYSALLRRRPSVHPLSLLALTFGLGIVFLAPAFAYEMFGQGRFLSLDATTVLAVAYTAVAPSILAYLFFNRGVALIGANRAAPLFHLIPLFGSVIAIAWLGESLGAFHLLGWGLILAGVFVAARG